MAFPFAHLVNFYRVSLPLTELLLLILQRLREVLGSERRVCAGTDARRLIVGDCDFWVRELLPGEGDPALMGDSFPLQGKMTIVVAPYIPRQVAHRLREQGQYYADAMGNIWLEALPLGLTVLVTGKRSRRLRLGTGAAFQLQGLRLLVHLLANPGLLACSAAELAKITQVQRSVTTDVLANLTQQGFLVGVPGGRLVNLAALTARWLNGYRDLLRPRLPTQRYRWVDGQPAGLAWCALARRTKSLLGGPWPPGAC